MDKNDMKKVLAGISIAGLLAGASLSMTGCAAQSSCSGEKQQAPASSSGCSGTPAPATGSSSCSGSK